MAVIKSKKVYLPVGTPIWEARTPRTIIHTTEPWSGDGTTIASAPRELSIIWNNVACRVSVASVVEVADDSQE